MNVRALLDPRKVPAALPLAAKAPVSADFAAPHGQYFHVEQRPPPVAPTAPDERPTRQRVREEQRRDEHRRPGEQERRPPDPESDVHRGRNRGDERHADRRREQTERGEHDRERDVERGPHGGMEPHDPKEPDEAFHRPPDRAAGGGDDPRPVRGRHVDVLREGPVRR